MSADDPSEVLRLVEVSKSYRRGIETVDALRGANLEVGAGEVVAIVGRSGSGKSTLLHLAGGLDDPDAGTVEVAGSDLGPLPAADRAKLRCRTIGFVFQSFHLLSGLTAVENVALPLLIDRAPDAEARAVELLERVGLGERVQHFPAELSGGEMQRVAVARALAPKPALLLADEPTGNLDEESGKLILDLLLDHARQLRAALVLVTHDHDAADLADRVLTLTDGQLG